MTRITSKSYKKVIIVLFSPHKSMCVSFLSVFAKLQQVTISFVMSVCPSVHMEQLGSHYTDFREISDLSIFSIFCQESYSFIKIL